MRNPALRLVGIASSPGGGGVFGNRAEEELRLWLESRLDALGIDPVAYSRFVLSLLRRPDSALSPSLSTGGRHNRVRTRVKLPLQGEREQRRAVVQCLTNAADQKCGVESLVDELCAKLRNLEGGRTNDDKDECRKLEDDTKSSTFESLTPRGRALRYYAAFPALQSATPKKAIYKKDENLDTINNNNKNRTIGLNANNNKKNSNKNSISTTSNNKSRHKNTKMSIAIESRRTNGKESFGFAKSMEREREKERELELDQLRLAQLQAKFDESLEALWDSGPGNSQDKASIWAAPSLSIPSGPLWPVDTAELPPIFPFNDSSSSTTLCQESIINDSPIIPWDIDFSVDTCIDGNAKDKLDYNWSWSDYVGDGPWCWRMNKALDNSPQNDSCLFTFPPCKTPTVIGKESCSHSEVNGLQNVVVVLDDDNEEEDDDDDENDDDDDDDDNDNDGNDGDDDEDLLTSARTHFCPIKDDGNWVDGTTFPVNNNFERVAYRRSDSGNLLYLPGGESPYMEYRDDTVMPQVPGFTLKFRVHQCDKSIQTDPVRSPIKRRILAEDDHFYYSSIDTDDALAQEADGVEKDTFILAHLGWTQPSVSLLNDRKR
ncbi:uncharacterized protein LOC107044805 isoform X2 [Diachasma alloeum]|uniref:uncharacterized protein LOC107044805 isoform X2 n=1 Tax=Diachasma alloeum TaxID=454923 RepID=UPI0007381F17|nr:uncharacterized protein LOC107044805 isoform X2 [Diachasma alloeum]